MKITKNDTTDERNFKAESYTLEVDGIELACLYAAIANISSHDIKKYLTEVDLKQDGENYWENSTIYDKIGRMLGRKW